MSDDIWVPPDLNSLRGVNPKRVKVTASIQDAVYHKADGRLAVQVRLADGSSRAVVFTKSSWLYHGRSHDELPQHEIDKEMEKTAELFRQSRGRKITVELDEDQATLR